MNLPPNSETPDQIPPQLVAPDAPNTSPAAAPTPAGKPLKVKKRGKFWKGLGLTLLLGSGAGAAYLTQTEHGKRNLEIIQESVVHPLEIGYQAKQNPELVFQQEGSDVVNILLVGRDQNYKQVYDKQGRNVSHAVDNTSPARSDTMIIVSLDRVKKTIRMVSLPRDVMVHMPPNKYDVSMAKLNAAHAYGGVRLLEKTLHDELGITIHHHAVIKFDGFMNLVDEVNGVYVDVIGALKRDGSRGDLRYTDSWAIPPLDINLHPGKQWLNGKQAHAYVRFRMDLEGDTGRIRRQQSLMRALASRLKQLPITQIPNVMKMIREQFETDMDDSQLASTGVFAQGLGETSKMQPITLYGSYTERGSAKLNRKRNKALLHAIFGPTFDADNFLQNSPTVKGYEFGPDETKPDTREILREAGLIEGEPRIATSGETSPDQPPPSPLAPNGFASPPTGLMPGSVLPGVAPTARDPFAFTSPEAPGMAAEPGRGAGERGRSEISGASNREGSAESSASESSASESSSRRRSSRESSSRESSSRESPSRQSSDDSASESSSSEERPRTRRSRRVRVSREPRTSERASERRRVRTRERTSDDPESSSRSSEQSAQESPIPRAEVDSDDLNVESPIPRAEN